MKGPKHGTFPAPKGPPAAPKGPPAAPPRVPASPVGFGPPPAPAPAPFGGDSDWFAQAIGAADVKQRGALFSPGQYLLRVEQLVRKLGENPQKNLGQTLFIGRFQIVEVLAFVEGETDEHGRVLWEDTLAAGEHASWVLNMSKRPQQAAEEVKSLLCALEIGSGRIRAASDYSAAQWSDRFRSAVQEPGDFYAGAYVVLHARKKRLKDGGPFTPHDWYAYVPEGNEGDEGDEGNEGNEGNEGAGDPFIPF